MRKNIVNDVPVFSIGKIMLKRSQCWVCGWSKVKR